MMLIDKKEKEIKMKLGKEEENKMLDKLGEAFFKGDMKKVFEILKENKNVELI